MNPAPLPAIVWIQRGARGCRSAAGDTEVAAAVGYLEEGACTISRTSASGADRAGVWSPSMR
jgi:hypothetical protein